MALATKCQTPGAHYHTSIGCRSSHPARPLRGEIAIRVELPFTLHIDKAEAERLEANIHNALELVLAPYFIGEV